MWRALHAEEGGRRYAWVIVATVVAAMGVAATTAVAATPSPGLTLHTFAAAGPFAIGESPVNCSEVVGGQEQAACYGYQVTVTNSGSVPSAAPIVLSDHLPKGFVLNSSLLFLEPAFHNGQKGNVEREPESGDCSQQGEPVTVTCTYPGALEPDEALELRLFVSVEPGTPTGEQNTATATAPGSPETLLSEPLAVGAVTPVFGPSALQSFIAASDGTPDTQAGDHPYEMTTRIDLSNVVRRKPEGPFQLDTVHDLKDVIVDLPVGLLGDAQATPKCTFAQLASHAHCPLDTRVGQIATEPEGPTSAYTGLFNMVPEPGVAAEFGFEDGLHSTHAIYASLAPTPSGYIVRATTREVPQVPLTQVIATFSGDPEAVDGTNATQVPFFTNPSDCSSREARTSTVHMDSWQEPGVFTDNGLPSGEPLVETEPWKSLRSSVGESPPVTGCNLLRFQPSGFTVKPDTQTADKPTGLTFDLKIPEPETPETLATPPLRDATVTLPPGLTVDPSAAGGLQACSEAQIGWLGATGPHGEELPNVHGPAGEEPNRGLTNFSPAAPSCPDASKIGSVEVTSPLTAEPLQGSVFLARQQENPFASLLAGYIVIDDPTTGIIVKVPGELKTNPETGQITGVFDQNPQLPFSELKIHFFGGERGDLATPEACGSYTTTSDFEPWSAPESGPDATPTDTFNITGGCVSAFTPAFSSGLGSPQAGSFSPFLLSISKQDDEQGMAGLTVNLPPGLIGKITGVGQCSDSQVAAAQARSGLGQGAQELASPSCPSSSLLGTVTTATGPGSEPFSVTGNAYLTGPYHGAPYGIAVIVPAIAGPFDLGVVVIRQALFIDPNDAHVTDVSDPFPTIRDGIPLRIQRVDVDLNRENFTLNPTSCQEKHITATATSITGTQAGLSSRFQATDCQSLPFHPEFSASTSGRTSKADGASFNVRIGFHAGEANIHRVELTIPSVLPSRLTTIQKACRDTVFNVNPASCPPESLIATASARTPLLPDPLSGPVYFVSHGGAAFPDTEIVLQGDNVKLILDGHTDIKKGVTYSRFETVPDAPVSSFEFKAPEGRYSIFGAFGNLCQKQINAPTRITAQNGAVFSQETPVEVENCPNALSVLSHRVKGRSITVTVAVPAAGTLTATGKGLSKATRTSHGRGTLTLTLKATRRGRVNTKVKLSFAPTHGKHLTATIAANAARSSNVEHRSR